MVCTQALREVRKGGELHWITTFNLTKCVSKKLYKIDEPQCATIIYSCLQSLIDFIVIHREQIKDVLVQCPKSILSIFTIFAEYFYLRLIDLDFYSISIQVSDWFLWISCQWKIPISVAVLINCFFWEY